MRRRQFLAAAVVAAAAGCSSRPTASAGPAPAPPSAATAAGLIAAGATGSEGRPGTPQEILRRSTVPVLCYHQVREQTAADSAGARPLICPPGMLEGHLRALTEAGMQPVTSTQLVDHLELGTALPDKPVMLSFDDASVASTPTRCRSCSASICRPRSSS